VTAEDPGCAALRGSDGGRELGISEQAAVSTLERLWRLQLIIPVGYRPPGYKWGPAPEERVAALRFRLTGRGKEKLKWVEGAECEAA